MNAAIICFIGLVDDHFSEILLYIVGAKGGDRSEGVSSFWRRVRMRRFVSQGGTQH